MQGQDALISSFPVKHENWPLWSRLKAGFFVLVIFELAFGFFTLTHTQWNPGEAAGYAFSSRTTAVVLFGLIILGTIVGTGLFWMLGRYVIRSRALLNQMSDGICVTDRDWRVYSFNNAFASITGLSPDEIANKPLRDLMPGCNAGKHSHQGERWECEFEGVRPNGDKYCANVSVFVLNEENGVPANCLITLKDMTELKASQHHIHQLAFVDELTGLANRPRFQKHLADCIAKARRHETSFGILFLDLDGFKDINDSLGHDAGDQVLRAMGERLSAAVRDNDMVARLGGDEFCIIVERIASEKDVTDIAERCLHQVSQPLEVSGRTLRPRTSVGIAIFPRDGDTRESLLQAADTAMYAAKKSGKHRFAFYTRELTEAAERKLSLEHDLREAIERRQFELYYQPQVCLHTGKMSGVEALIRWHHHDRGIIPPNEFIAIAERIGMINELGEWVINSACQQASLWSDIGLPEFTVSVNISGSHFRSPQLISTVSQALDETGLDPSRLELEVTEGVMQTGGDSISVFKRIKKLGVSIAIDDFGTGYSSLSSLKKLPLDCLKIDREFIHDMLDKKEHSVIIATIIGMGQALGLKVVAEGVERQDHVLYLRGLNCNTVQGYFFSKPVPATEIPALAVRNFLNDTPTENDKPNHLRIAHP
ncbi:MAG TPA: GGDEF and EAL domain-containing protein [Gammaproteobacteria bacterium]|nr:GGDEF and EAL domain-containing protein [Gammaproteobacteria bacterium]